MNEREEKVTYRIEREDERGEEDLAPPFVIVV